MRYAWFALALVALLLSLAGALYKPGLPRNKSSELQLWTTTATTSATTSTCSVPKRSACRTPGEARSPTKSASAPLPGSGLAAP